MSIESTMVGYYAQRAQEYERIFHKPERQDDLRALRHFVAQTFVGKRVLEVACGTGYWTEVLSNSALSVTAVDINDEVLEIAQAKPLNQQQVSFQRADVYSLPKFPHPFTGGLAGFWWSHIPKKRLTEFLTGFHQTLAADSAVVFIDNAYVEGSSTPLSRTDAEGNTYQKRKLDDGSIHEVLKNFPNESELRATLAPVTSDLQIEFLQYYWRVTYVLK